MSSETAGKQTVDFPNTDANVGTEVAHSVAFTIDCGQKRLNGSRLVYVRQEIRKIFSCKGVYTCGLGCALGPERRLKHQRIVGWPSDDYRSGCGHGIAHSRRTRRIGTENRDRLRRAVLRADRIHSDPQIGPAPVQTQLRKVRGDQRGA